MRFAVIGAGFSGAVIAQQLAEANHVVTVFESRGHVAGNCHTERDSKTGIMVHQYGPHIFHTDDEEVWSYINHYGVMRSYINRVKTTYNKNVYSLPINLHTINQFYGKAFSPSEAINFIASVADKSITEPESFEEQALKFVGEDLYNAFFKGYTLKQWGVEPAQLPSSILKRLPLRFNYDDNYFKHRFQGMPDEGYTSIVSKILDHQNITVQLNCPVVGNDVQEYDHIFFTGPIDGWFKYKLGRLGYRTLDFKKYYSDGDYQGCAVMNYGDIDIPFTRIAEHKHFSPWENHEKTVYFEEYSRKCEADDIPYYPIRLLNEKKLLRKYVALANAERKVSFVGRLGTYRYLDMDVTIREALDASRQTLAKIQKGEKIPSFFVDVE